MKILFIGDIVGSPGRTAFARAVTRWRGDNKADVVIANAENAAGGRGLTPSLAEELFSAGADALTMGDHTWDQKDLAPYLDREKRIVRPANFPPGCPGSGFVKLETRHGEVAVLNLIGRVFMPPQDCPLRKADEIINNHDLCRTIIVDIHAEATSEKIVTGRYLDGRVTAVVGTHTHVQTSDETILPGGTAYITDVGMTGPKDSVLGRSLDPVLGKFLTGMPAKFDVATNDVCMEGVLIETDNKTGRAKRIRRIRESM